VSLSELQNWLVFMQDAPENIRSYLIGLVWTLVGLLLVGAILKLLSNKQFKELYFLLGTSAKMAGKLGNAIVKEAAKSFELPEPYPRIAKFFAVIFMLNSYAAAFVFLCLTLFVAVLTVLSNTPSFWGRTGAMLFSLVPLFFSWFFFADAERDRVKLFLRSSGHES